MDVLNVCRCCLSPGSHKDFFSSNSVFKRKDENYSDMLIECFNVVLSKSSNISNTICKECIENIKSSVEFKRKVLNSEQELLKHIQEMKENENKLFEVKVEPKQDSDEDDHFETYDDVDHEVTTKPISADNVKHEPKELTPKKRTERRRKIKLPEEYCSNNIRTLVTRLTNSISSETTICISKQKKQDTKKIVKKTQIIKKDSPFKEGKINLIWPRVSKSEKEKHKENLQTILKYSNITPFKNKSLLGFLCGYCDQQYPDPKDLRSHTEDTHRKGRLNLKTSFYMNEFNVKLDITDLKCTLCDEKMDDLTILKQHLVKSHDKTIHNDIKDHMVQFKLKKGDIYDCALCTATYETFKMLMQHMNKHYSNYTCSKCDSSFTTKRSLNAHKATHQEGSFKCDHCEKIFSSKTKKQYHEKMKHLGARNISNCPYCNEPFRSYYQRNQHLIKVHNSDARYKCNVCDKNYVLKSLLMYHIKKSHLMERNFQCTECGYRFFSKKALKAHMIKHNGERIYMCEVCHKSYARKYTLREHMRIHNNDRRFKCDVCAMTFVQKCSLKSHLLSNHGISMAACDITSM